MSIKLYKILNFIEYKSIGRCIKCMEVLKEVCIVGYMIFMGIIVCYSD